MLFRNRALRKCLADIFSEYDKVINDEIETLRKCQVGILASFKESSILKLLQMLKIKPIINKE